MTEDEFTATYKRQSDIEELTAEDLLAMLYASFEVQKELSGKNTLDTIQQALYSLEDAKEALENALQSH